MAIATIAVLALLDGRALRDRLGGPGTTDFRANFND
jgi:hypothetical protein